jgi:hypothetical protein
MYVILFIPPILFGIGLLLSNQNYLRYRYSNWGLPISFITIFFYGSALAHFVSDLFLKSLLTTNILNSLIVFLMVLYTVKLFIKNIKISWRQILFLVFMSAISVIVDASISNHSLSNLEKYALGERLDLTVLIYQLSMSLCIVYCMKNTTPKNSIHI